MAHDNLLIMVALPQSALPPGEDRCASQQQHSQQAAIPDAVCRDLRRRVARRLRRAIAGPAPGRYPRPKITLHTQLYKPDGDGPFPTVIALHGCGGLGGHAEPVLPRYRDWVEQLLKAGHAVVLPDSYGSRELGPQCRDKERRVLARRERVADIAATRRWLAAAGLGGAGPRQPDGMGERGQRPVVGGASASPGAMTGRTSARRSRSIRTAGSPPASAGARGCRRCC